MHLPLLREMDGISPRDSLMTTQELNALIPLANIPFIVNGI